MSHPYYTLVLIALVLWFVYLFAESSKRTRERIQAMREAIAGLLDISDCQCNRAGTCERCTAWQVLKKEQHIAREDESSRDRLDEGPNY